MGGEPVSTFNSATKQLILRGKVIPFSEMSKITIQSSQVMGKTMVAIFFKHNGRRKALVGGTLIVNSTSEIEEMLVQLNELIGQQ